MLAGAQVFLQMMTGSCVCQFVNLCNMTKEKQKINVDAASRTAEVPEEGHMLERTVLDLVPRSPGALIMEQVFASITCFPSVCVS